jgi:hypothetical protein
VAALTAVGIVVAGVTAAGAFVFVSSYDRAPRAAPATSAPTTTSPTTTSP